MLAEDGLPVPSHVFYKSIKFFSRLYFSMISEKSVREITKN